MKTILFILCLSLPLLAKKNEPKEKPSAAPEVEVVTNFYRCYLDFKVLEHPKTTAEKFCQESESIFSEGVKKLMEENQKRCKKIAPNEVCGFGADSDIFLDAQDYSDQLNFKNSKFQAAGLKDHVVQVEFDLFPEDRNAASHNKISFKMVAEKGSWKVDDITYLRGRTDSMRELIKTEMKSLSEPAKK